MRIGMVCPYSFDEPGGVQAHVLDLAEIFLERGHHVEVLGPATERANVPDYVCRGGGAVAIPYNGSVARIAVGAHVKRTVRHFLHQGDFDVLHVHEPNAQSYSMAAVKHAAGPIVATYHASAKQSLALKMGLPFLRPNLDKIRAGIAVSDVARAWQASEVGTDPLVIPNGVRTELFLRQQSRRACWTNNEERLPRLVFLGRTNEPRKGLDILLKALECLHPRPELTVVGSGPVRFIPGVNFVGRVSDREKARLLAEADIFIAPNTGGESFGIVLVEAMAAGCAVIASDLPAFRAVLTADDGQPAGVMFPVGDHRCLAENIRVLLEDADRRAFLKQLGRKRSLAFDWSVVADQVFAVYEAVALGERVGVEP